MKGRPKLIRTIGTVPTVSGFVPTGEDGRYQQKERVFLEIEEYEALRLSDYELVNQCQAAAIMDISRPTFTRIYQRARQKIALALVEGRRVIIKGGNVKLDDTWYECADCGAIFQIKDDERVCALCRGVHVEPYQDEKKLLEYEQRTSCGEGKGRGRGRRSKKTNKEHYENSDNE